jgi:hypothetical protein
MVHNFNGEVVRCIIRKVAEHRVPRVNECEETLPSILHHEYWCSESARVSYLL